MFTQSSNDAKIDQEIAASLEELKSLRDNPEKSAALVERMVQLNKLKSDRGLEPPSLDTVLIVGANIFGILWLARYERENVIRSRSALGFVMKPR